MEPSSAAARSGCPCSCIVSCGHNQVHALISDTTFTSPRPIPPGALLFPFYLSSLHVQKCTPFLTIFTCA